MSHSRSYSLLILAVLAVIAGCTSTPPFFGPLDYTPSMLNVTIRVETPIEHASLQVDLAALDALGQREVFSETRYVDLVAGTSTYTYHVELPPGAYRCYLHLHDGDERRAAVIRELVVSGETAHG